MKTTPKLAFIAGALALTLGSFNPVLAAGSSATPPELVSSYDALADTILGAKNTEAQLVRAILAMTYRHAEMTIGRAQSKMTGGQAANEEIETVASLVSQLGNEGDAAVAAVRKRLLEGGHHHNAAGEQQGLFDEGFVVVNKAARKVFLDAATALGKLAASKDAAAVKAAWQPVATQYAALTSKGR